MRLIVRALLAVLLMAGGALASVEPAAAASGTDVPRPPGGTYTCPDGSSVTVGSNGSAWRPLRLSPSGTKLTPTGYTYQLVVDGTVTVELTDVRTGGPIRGDFGAAGGKVSLDEPVAGDAWLAGG